MVASTSVPLSDKSQDRFISYYMSTQHLMNVTRTEFRSRFEYIDRVYQREMDTSDEQSKAKQANKSGDPSRFQNMTVPVVMPQVEAAVTYQTGVFLTGYPIFGVVSSPEFIDAALQLETVFENNSIRGGWARHLMMFFRDGFKYNFAPIEVDWHQEVTYSVDTNVQRNLKEGTPKEIIWSGNRIRRLDPYNTFVDTRVEPANVYKDGEFAGWTEIMTRIKLKSFIAELPDKIIANIVPAFESGRGASTSTANTGAMSYYVPTVNPAVPEDRNSRGGTNWFTWAGIDATGEKKIDYKDSYEVTTLYAKVLPSEFELKIPKSNTPQIYKLIIVNHQHIIYAELQTNAHAYLPILIGQPLEDGLGYQTKSLATNGTPFQELATAHMTANLASRRRAISDRVLFDPSRISNAAINSANPSAKIPVRPSAYGKNIGESVYQFPYREDQQSHNTQEVEQLLQMANRLNGQNQVSQGQFVKGNKTRKEVDTALRNANGRDQMASILMESQVFVPMKEILKLNTLQFQGGTSLYNREKQQVIEVDPVQLRKAVLEFKVTDGLTPADKVLNSETFAVAMQAFGSAPQLAASYNVGQLFSYMMKTQGAKISDFEKSPEQIAYEEAIANWSNIAQLLIEKGGDPKQMPPQPLPEQFGYTPAQNKPTPKDTSQQAGSSTPPGTAITGA